MLHKKIENCMDVSKSTEKPVKLIQLLVPNVSEEETNITKDRPKYQHSRCTNGFSFTFNRITETLNEISTDYVDT